MSSCWGSLGEYGNTGRFSRKTSVFAHGAKVTVAKMVVDPWGRAEGAGVELAAVPVWGEYGDTNCFSGDTSVFAHGAMVTVAKMVVDPWGRAEGAGVPVLGEYRDTGYFFGDTPKSSSKTHHVKIVIECSPFKVTWGGCDQLVFPCVRFFGDSWGLFIFAGDPPSQKLFAINRQKR